MDPIIADTLLAAGCTVVGFFLARFFSRNDATAEQVTTLTISNVRLEAKIETLNKFLGRVETIEGDVNRQGGKLREHDVRIKVSEQRIIALEEKTSA